MALPANYSSVPVYGRYIDFAGTPAHGTVTFTPSLGYVKNPDADVLILSTDLVATLDETGAFSIHIPATDDPDVTPSGFTWTVTEHLNGKTWRPPYSISVPQDTQAPGIDLVTVAPVLPASEVSSYVTSVDGQAGDVNLVGMYAPLDDGGKVPLDNIPEITGGVLSINGASGALLIGATDIGALPASGGTLTGSLTLAADPTDPLQAATKAYVDAAVDGFEMSVTSVNGQVGAVSLSPSGIGALAADQNLSDLTDVESARSSLGLGNAATKNTGATSGTVAAGDDGRLTGAAQKSANLSDLTSASAARTNLGLGTSTTRNVGTAGTDVAAGDAPQAAVVAHTATPDPHGDRAYADGKFFPLEGGTLAGPLSLPGAPTSALHAATKDYTDTKVASITFPVASVNGQSGAVSLTAADVGAAATGHTHTAAAVGAIATTARAAANGVASLDATSRIPAMQLPATTPRNVWTPQALGFQAWTCDPYTVVNPVAKFLTPQRLYVCGINITETTQVNRVIMFARGYGGVTSNRYAAGIYREDGTKVTSTSSPVALAAAGQTGSPPQMVSGHIGATPITMPSTATLSPGRYWVTWVLTTGGTADYAYYHVQNEAPVATANFFFGTPFARAWYLASQSNTPATLDQGAAGVLTDHDVPIMALALV
ncbi:hypothetical protein [[Kitasatospora] papulosa]|uniref:hypothetical protein n=1 Tax=[Kitasatospora] papulosa TaxID=1464011 RepID=UPI0036993B39